VSALAVETIKEPARALPTAMATGFNMSFFVIVLTPLSN
jgi:hypothetical protein